MNKQQKWKHSIKKNSHVYFEVSDHSSATDTWEPATIRNHAMSRAYARGNCGSVRVPAPPLSSLLAPWQAFQLRDSSISSIQWHFLQLFHHSLLWLLLPGTELERFDLEMKTAQILILGIPFMTSTTLYLTKLGSYNFIPSIKALVVQSQATMKKSS